MKKDQIDSSKLLEINVVARRLNVAPRTVRRMIADVNCPLVGIRVYKNCIRVTETSVIACLQYGIIGDNY